MLLSYDLPPALFLRYKLELGDGRWNEPGVQMYWDANVKEPSEAPPHLRFQTRRDSLPVILSRDDCQTVGGRAFLLGHSHISS